MVRFLKLSNQILNTYYIRKINIYQNPNQYKIWLEKPPEQNGYIFFGFGYLDTFCEEEEIEVKEEDHAEDYKVVKKWIELHVV